MLDANKDQLMKGKNSEGQKIGVYRSKSYAKYKKKFNPRGVVDLKLTGKFHGSFFIDAKRFPILFGAKDKKAPLLEEKYGDSIFGLTESSQRKVGKVIKDNYLARVRKILQL